MDLVLIGKPGAGKGTLAKELVRRLDIPYIGSGDIARELAATDPNTQSRLRAGLMAPEEPMRERTLHAIEAALATKGSFILDGYPRSIAQLYTVLELSCVPTFVLVEADTLVCLERIHRRGRKGENADSVAQRFKDYESDTIPLIHVLIAAGRLKRVDNEGEISQTVDIFLRELDR